MYRKTVARVLAMGTSCAILFGCANLDSVYRTFRVDKLKSVSIDAKQRVVIAAPAQSNPEAFRPERLIAVCAEPSPDALSAFANSASASLQGSNKDAQNLAIQGALTATESAAFVGLRTQTIQLLRDGMYRICEGYLSGALSAKDFSTLQRRYQNLMMGLLAIEQLTGAVTPKPVTLNGSAGASTGGDTAKQQDQLADKQKTLATDSEVASNADSALKSQADIVKPLQSDYDKKSGAYKALSAQATPKPDDAAIAAAKRDADDAQSVLTPEKQKLDTLMKARDRAQAIVKIDQDAVKAAQDALAAAANRVSANSSGVSNYYPSDSGKLDASTSATLADKIELIVRDVISTSFIQDTCLTFIQQAGANNQPTQFSVNPELSNKYAQQNTDIRQVCVDLLKSQASQIITTATK